MDICHLLLWRAGSLQGGIMAVNGPLKGVWPMQQRVGRPLDLAKLHDTAQPVAVVCELGTSHTLSSGHGSVHNASHHVNRVLNVYAAAICKGEAPVALGCCLDSIGLERDLRL